MALLLLLSVLPHFVLADVDFSKITPCALNSCFPFHASSIGCAQFTTGCFCNQALAPLSCAYKSCNGSNWFALEDWFDSICPSPQLVDFGTMPACSRTCIRTALIPTWCPAFNDDAQNSVPKISRNCFCRLNETFTSLTSCLVDGCLMNKTEASTRLQEQYTRTCIYNLGNRPDSGGLNDGDEIIQRPSTDGSQGNGISPVEWFGIIFGIITGFVSLIAACFSFRKWKRGRRVRLRWQCEMREMLKVS